MIETARLLLRPWRDADRAPFAAMGADAQVMAHFPALLSRAESDAGVDRQMALQTELGHCFWALERRDTAEFIGFCGLIPVRFACPVEGEIEIGWRLAREHWGQGLAREAAQASLDWGFASGITRIVSFTVPGNRRSWGLMERLGLRRRADLDFDHPRIAAGSPLRRHIVYEALR
ncbi:GNAT family N-acetyltransferase [Sandarakinorhabdus sp. AAP62]|uniref:GNAT family N-acetyltransferase n=1 Tax=Sandarakinorhabdus sp. AAP62 TaxID=1248916 RepID=UPI0003015D45|nr:GNAT family N-acetyltransferase [Sandarakinorhabdus sp. AAP62]